MPASFASTLPSGAPTHYAIAFAEARALYEAWLAEWLAVHPWYARLIQRPRRTTVRAARERVAQPKPARPQASCHPEKPHFCKGLCRNCYYTTPEWRAHRKAKREREARAVVASSSET